jgi:hypothetical protein
VRYRDDIDDAIWQQLKSWIERQQTEERSFAIQIQLGVAAKPVNEILAMLNTDKQGTWQTKPKEKKQQITEKKEKKKREEHVAPREYHTRRQRAIPGGIWGVTKIDKSHRCLEIVPKGENLGKRLWRPSVNLSEGKATIYINTDPEQMPGMEAKIKSNPEQITDILCIAYADAAALDPTDFEPLFDGLRMKGYEIDEATPPHEIRWMVSNFFVSELTKQKSKRGKIAA